MSLTPHCPSASDEDLARMRRELFLSSRLSRCLPGWVVCTVLYVTFVVPYFLAFPLFIPPTNWHVLLVYPVLAALALRVGVQAALYACPSGVLAAWLAALDCLAYFLLRLVVFFRPRTTTDAIWGPCTFVLFAGFLAKHNGGFAVDACRGGRPLFCFERWGLRRCAEGRCVGTALERATLALALGRFDLRSLRGQRQGDEESIVGLEALPPPMQDAKDAPKSVSAALSSSATAEDEVSSPMKPTNSLAPPPVRD
ncbi:hypothetical protein JCM10449v2_007458 [Rhodotorula kratochvilovae]